MSGPEAPRPAVPPPEPVGVVDKLILRGENALLTAEEVSTTSITAAIQTVRTRSASDRLHLRDAIDAWKRRNATQLAYHAELDRLKAGTPVEAGSAAVVRVQDAVVNQFDALHDQRAVPGEKIRAIAAIFGPFITAGAFIASRMASKTQRPVMEQVQDPAHPNDPTKKITRPKTEPDPENPGQNRPVTENSGFGRFLKMIGIAGAVTTAASWGSSVLMARQQRNSNVAQGPIPSTKPRPTPVRK